VFEESGGRSSRLAMYEYLDSILRSGKPVTALSKNFSWAAVSSQMKMLTLAAKKIPQRGNDANTVHFEAGGGSGFGFQLYCDNVMVLTAGVGGGGGFSLNPRVYASPEQSAAGYENCDDLINPNSNYGGGGGGGIQFMKSFVCDRDPEKLSVCDQFDKMDAQSANVDWLDIGGGGGCQSSSNNASIGIEGGAEYTRLSEVNVNVSPRTGDSAEECESVIESSILCLFGEDESTLRYRQSEYTEFLKRFTEQLEHQCEVVQIFGGGGGGGGTANCCMPYMVGYGFAFAMNSVDQDGGHNNHISTTTTYTAGTQRRADKEHHIVDSSETANVTTLCAQDLFSDRFFNDVATSGVCIGGYRNWSCMCSVLYDSAAPCYDDQHSSDAFGGIEALWLMQFVCPRSQRTPNLAALSESYRKYNDIFAEIRKPILTDGRNQDHCENDAGDCCVRIDEYRPKQHPAKFTDLESDEMQKDFHDLPFTSLLHTTILTLVVLVLAQRFVVVYVDKVYSRHPTSIQISSVDSDDSDLFGYSSR
jgi:hypothetical protein